MTSKSTLEFALMGMMRFKPQTGYDLRKTFTTTGMRHYSDSPGSIYPALKRLEARGWIAPAPAQGEADARRRQAYALAESGKEALVKWVDQPVTHDDVVLRVSELMLRFALMDGNVPRATTIRFLADFEREMGNYAAESRAKLEAMRLKAGLHTGVLAYESGIEGMEHQVDWARRARELFEQAEGGQAPPARQ